ncbi:anaphase-promoting complex subunit 3 [Nematocida minor]|uniref:anaphase-promoting complex subunit 3 n=1 Tax=Nematocida minor TaxID=1912983 RepID=UPI0022210CD9|nr:anaphase-promoting complex subunit 3 [Nematocida minor]KAI5190224.1 anaphase-promoting complex subunit 3 [Nematocida minor]
MEEFLWKCIKYERFKDAIYAVEALEIEQKKENPLLLGYLFMRNGEYRRALQYLSKNHSYSSVYYQALCHRKIKDYNQVKYLAVELLSAAKKSVAPRNLTPLEKMYILETDRSFILSMLAEAEIETGCPEVGFKRSLEAVAEESLLYSTYQPLLEESTKAMRKQEKEDENMSNSEISESKKEESEVHTGIDSKLAKRLNKEKDPSARFIIKSIITESSLLKKISRGSIESIPAYISIFSQMPLYSISRIAVQIFECGYMQRSGAVFEYIRARDPCFIEGMHYYSSILWHSREKNLLVSLSRDIFGIDPTSNVAWAVLGNHFSLKKDTDKALECFERSLSISRDPYVLCLMGHEQFMNSNLTESLKCFIESMKIKSENYSGIAGCGLIYEKIGKKESAEYCFTRAISANPQNILLAYLAVKYFVSQIKLENAYSLLQKHLRIKESVETVAMNVLNNSKWVEEMYEKAAENEQTASLAGSFLLELSYILVHSGYLQSGEILAKESTGRGQYFHARKTYVFDLIASLSSGDASISM